MNSNIISTGNAAHYQWGTGCDSWVLTETPGLSVKQEQMPPATREQLHYHTQAAQFFYILQGVAVFYIDDEKITVQEQQGINISPGQRHYIANESEGAISFLVISQPPTTNDRVNV